MSTKFLSFRQKKKKKSINLNGSGKKMTIQNQYLPLVEAKKECQLHCVQKVNVAMYVFD